MDIKEIKATLLRILKDHPIFLSLYEAAFILAVSNVFLLFLLFAYIVATPGTQFFSISLAVKLVQDAFSSTEIFVYILALVAPALWIMVYNWRARRNPIIYFLLLFIQAAIILGSSHIYGQAKFGKIGNDAFVDEWAINCYVAGLIIWYITLVYDKFLNASEPMGLPDSGADILKQLRKSP